VPNELVNFTKELNASRVDNRMSGVYYAQCLELMREQENKMEELAAQPAASYTEAKDRAQRFGLDVTVYNKMRASIFNVSHKGEVLAPVAYRQIYGSLLRYTDAEGKAHVYAPSSISAYSSARVLSVEADSTYDPLHKSLFYADYYAPKAYRNTQNQFNCANSFEVFAKDTHTDIQPVYTYLQHLCGECYPHVLGWLKQKLLEPTKKTEVCIILPGRAQGTGKTTFAEVICRALFGANNVVVTSKFDAQQRFNADTANALVLCQEEREEQDKHITAAELKSLVTAPTVRVELKGVDAYNSPSYTEYVITTNRDVPVKFETADDQRRFMVIDVDADFTAKKNPEARECFAWLYGIDGVPFIRNIPAIQQFKYDLLYRIDVADYKAFPHTKAYERCFSIPQTVDRVTARTELEALLPYAKASIEAGELVSTIDGSSIGSRTVAFADGCFYVNYAYLQQRDIGPAYIGRAVMDIAGTAQQQGLDVSAEKSKPDLFPQLHLGERYQNVVCIKAHVQVTLNLPPAPPTTKPQNVPSVRPGVPVYVDDNFKICDMAQATYMTVNNMKQLSVKDKTHNVATLDSFLYESDDYVMGDIEALAAKYGSFNIPAMQLFAESLNSAAQCLKEVDSMLYQVTWSGSKSLHAIVRILDAPDVNDADALQQYDWLWHYIATLFPEDYVIDMSTCDPGRLTRVPNNRTRKTKWEGKYTLVGQQTLLLHHKDNYLELNWRPMYKQYKERVAAEPAKKAQLRPHKAIYDAAAKALLEGTFFSSSQWDGQRQKLFFGAYRVLRVSGKTQQQVRDIVAEALAMAPYVRDKQYWSTRCDCNLVQKIEAQLSEEEGEW